MIVSKEIASLKKQLQREINARKKAEGFFKAKTSELSKANQVLKSQNRNLSKRIIEKTKELEASEFRFRQIVEDASDIIYRTDAKGFFTYANCQACILLGIPMEEIIGEHFLKFIRADWQERVYEFYLKKYNSKDLISYLEFPIITHEGESRWVGQNHHFILKDGQIHEAVAVARDITENKATEEALLSTQLQLTHLIANLQSGVLVEDENRKVVLTNERFCQSFNMSLHPEELVGMDCAQALEEAKHLFKDPQRFSRSIKKLLAEKKTTVGEVLELKNGQVFERDFIPLVADGKYLGHLWQFRDITEAKRAEEALRISEKKYRGILENMELGLMEVDNNGTIIRVYDRFCQLTGYEAHELIGQNDNKMFFPKEYLPVLEKQQRDRMAGKAGNYEIQIVRKNGERLWVMISGTPIFDQEGKIIGSIGIHYDVSKQKKLQQQLFETRLKAEEAKEAEKQFLANMSHEIRTPLNAIIGMTHLLYDTSPTLSQVNDLDILKNSSEVLRLLINDLLDIAKLRAGKMEAQSKEFDLVGLVKTVHKTFQLKLDYKPVEVEAEIDPRIKTLMVGDDLLLNQILLNLLGNAEKFTEEGKIGIRVLQESRTDEQINVRFEVYDTGIGIPESKLDLIFQNFRQVDGNIKRRYGGTGLGLYIVKELVELQGGHISVYSELNKGTVFTFNIIYKDSKLAISHLPKEKQITSATFKAGFNILIVEDNSMNRSYLSSLLDKWAIGYDLAVNGKQGVEMASNQKYDLIFMDIQMPEMDGYEATLVIRSISNPNQETPIIALTASSAMMYKIDKAYQAGMDGYISKPFTPNQLYEVLKKYFEMDPLTEKLLTSEEVALPVLPAPEGSGQFCRDVLNNLYGNDNKFALEMFDAFLDKMNKEYPRIKLHLEDKDFKALSKLAHKMKPAFTMVGLPSLEKDFQYLEETAGKGNFTLPVLEQIVKNIELNIKAKLPHIMAERERLKVSC